MLWLLNLPTGLLLVILQRWIPESPRFLLAKGREQEARSTLARFGARLETGVATAVSSDRDGAAPSGLRQLVFGGYRTRTLALAFYGIAWGLVYYGFLTWVPAVLRGAGFDVEAANGLLARSALVAVPGALLVAVLYGWWSSKRTLLVFAGAMVFALVGIAIWDAGQGSELWLLAMLAALILTANGVNAMLPAYAAEVYPTHLRATGTGLVAAGGKLGGFLAPQLIAAVLLLAPGLAVPALVVAIPIGLAVLLLALKGVETRGRRLEETARADAGRGERGRRQMPSAADRERASTPRARARGASFPQRDG